MNKQKRIIITTGGTGGHIVPAVVLAQTLQKKGLDVLVVGDRNIIKYIENKGLNYRIIRAGSSLIKPKSVFNIFMGLLSSYFILKKFNPQIVLGFGCYATLPVLTVAKLLNKTIMLHEQNTNIGKVNGFFLKWAKYIFTSFNEIYGVKLEYSSKIEFTGLPIREEIKQLYNIKYTVDDKKKFNILITGGSGGASFFTTHFINIFKYFKDKTKEKIKVIQQVKTQEEINIAKNIFNRLNIENEVEQFFFDMPEKIKNANLVIARSGVGTAMELAVAGRPTIFVPSPNVANNHQYYNAKSFSDVNACILLQEKDFDEIKVSSLVENLIYSNEELTKLSNNIRSNTIIDADEKIFSIIDKEFTK